MTQQVEQVESRNATAAAAAIANLSDADLSARIGELIKLRKESDGKLPPELDNELRSLQSLANNRLQRQRRDAARDTLRLARTIRGNKPARMVIAALFKSTMGDVTKLDPDIKNKGTAEQIRIFAEEAATERKIEQLRSLFDLCESFVRSAPSLATTEVHFEGGVRAIDILTSTTGLRTSAKAVDQDVDAAIMKELASDATPQK